LLRVKIKIRGKVRNKGKSFVNSVNQNFSPMFYLAYYSLNKNPPPIFYFTPIFLFYTLNKHPPREGKTQKGGKGNFSL